jgi:hypothetical protein
VSDNPKVPPIARDLIPMARPYMEGKKLPDEKYALILRTSRAEAALEALQRRIKTYIGAECKRCKDGDELFIEPSTGFYTHTLGGNYCSAHKVHNILGSEAADAARSTHPA